MLATVFFVYAITSTSAQADPCVGKSQPSCIATTTDRCAWYFKSAGKFRRGSCGQIPDCHNYSNRKDCEAKKATDQISNVCRWNAKLSRCFVNQKVCIPSRICDEVEDKLDCLINKVARCAWVHTKPKDNIKLGCMNDTCTSYDSQTSCEDTSSESPAGFCYWDQGGCRGGSKYFDVGSAAWNLKSLSVAIVTLTCAVGLFF
jgi:hypothetical protein